MKRLLLTSSGKFVTDSKIDFFGMCSENLRWGYVITAGKDVTDTSYMDVRKNRMKELKYDFKEIDIDNKSEDHVRYELKDVDVVYVEGGNTFYLLKAIRECNFEKIIRDKFEQGLIYVGSSAGSYVCCPTIETSAWKEKVKKDMHDRHGVTDFTAMNLVPFLMFVHYSEEYKQLIVRKVKELKYTLKILNDQQGLKVTGKKVELVGDMHKINI